MNYFRASQFTIFAPTLLVLGAALPILFLRATLYSVLALPLMPLIFRLGWVYRDKSMFLTYPAAVLAASVWAVVLYLALCTWQHFRSR